MKFIFCDKLPDVVEKNASYAHFQHVEFLNSSLPFLNVRQFCHTNQSQILNDIEAWHNIFTETAVKKVADWWISPNSRLLSWYPPVYDSIVFAVCLAELLKSNPQCAVCYVLQAPSEVEKYVCELFNVSPIKNYSLCVKSYFVPFLNYSRSTAGFIKRFFLKSRGSTEVGTQSFLFFSQVLNVSDLLKGKDHFYGTLLSSLKKDLCEQCLYFLYSPVIDRKTLQSIRNAYAQKNLSLVFTTDFFFSYDFIFSLFRGFRHFIQILLLSKTEHKITLLGHCSHSFFTEYLQKVVFNQTIYTELETHYSAKNLLSKVRITKVIYPYEEKSLEKALLTALSSAISYGFVHAVMHEGHLCYQIKKSPLITPPRPHKILTTGLAPGGWFERIGYSKENLLILGSPRYKAATRKAFNSKRRIIIIVSQPHELNTLNTLVAGDKNLFLNFDVTVRKYPYSGLAEQDAGFSKLKQLYPHLKEEGGNLEEQLQTHDIVFFSTSSGGIEAISHGLFGVHLNLDKLFVLNPLAQLGSQNIIPDINTHSELDAWLRAVQALTYDQFQTLQMKQVELVKKIYTEPSLDILF